MTVDASNILNKALSLSDAERADLAARLIDSLDAGSVSSAQSEWDDEIARRLADLDGRVVQPIAWHEARQQIDPPRD